MPAVDIKNIHSSFILKQFFQVFEDQRLAGTSAADNGHVRWYPALLELKHVIDYLFDFLPHDGFFRDVVIIENNKIFYQRRLFIKRTSFLAQIGRYIHMTHQLHPMHQLCLYLILSRLYEVVNQAFLSNIGFDIVYHLFYPI